MRICLFFLLIINLSSADLFDELLFELDTDSRAHPRHIPSSDEELAEMREAINVLGKTSSLLERVLGGERRAARITDRSSTTTTMLPNPFSIFETLGRTTEEIFDLKGPHICTNEIQLSIAKQSQNSTMASTSCQRFRDEYTCTIRSISGKVTKRIQDCCDGYTTQDITTNGCNQEITPELIKNLNISDFPTNSTLLFSKSSEKTFQLAGIVKIHEWQDKQVIESTNGEKFVVNIDSDNLHEIRVSCALKKETIKTGGSQILKFDGELTPANGDLLQVIGAQPNLTIFRDVIGEELREFLKEINSATVFAFTNKAFGDLPQSTKDQILRKDNKECVEELMKQHISTSGSYCATNLPRHIRSIFGSELLVDHTISNRIRIDHATIRDSTAFALNGIVHTIDQVLVKPHFLSWRDTLKQHNRKLADALKNISFDESVTIFVPPEDSPIADPLDNVVSGKLLTKFDLPGKLTTHSNSTIFYGSHDDSSRIFSMRLRMSTNDFSHTDSERIGCSKLIGFPIHSCKAVLQRVDRPLPRITHSIRSFLDSRRDLTRFAELWTRSNVSSEIRGTIFTLFVPIDDSFSPNSYRRILASQSSIEQFVRRHVVKSLLCASEIQRTSHEVRSTTYSSINGEMLAPAYDKHQTIINDILVQEVEHILTDGVIHIIESYFEHSPNHSLQPSQIARTPLNILSHILG